MKRSIRTRFTMGMIFLFLIILVLSVFSGYYMNKLSGKTSAILSENYLSVVYAREMYEGLVNINQEITTSSFSGKNADTSKINQAIVGINSSLSAEKGNITEPGEEELVAGIDREYSAYRDSVLKILKSPFSLQRMVYLQEKSRSLYEKLLHLSEMNGTAIQAKTDDAKNYSKSALTQMTILASFCFLIGMSFTFSFSSYFSQRFYQLYNGIKEIVSSNYNQHLYFTGNDEFYEISLLFNEMADKLRENKQKMSLTLQKESLTDTATEQAKEIKEMLQRFKDMEREAAALIAKIEKK